MSLYEAEFLGPAKPIKKPKVEKIPKKPAKEPKKPAAPKKEPKPVAPKKEPKKVEEAPPTPEPSEPDSIGKAVDEALAKPSRKRKVPEYLTEVKARKLFEKYHAESLKEENAKRPTGEKLPMETAQLVAQKQWSDEHFRDKVRKEQNLHQAKMFKMVHGRELAI